MIRTAGFRRLFVRPGSSDPTWGSPAPSGAKIELALYGQAHPGESRRFLGGQTAHDILMHGFQNRHYRFHAELNDWTAPTEWVERKAVFLADRPTDPAGLTGVQIEVALTLTEAELDKYELVRSETTATDYTGEPYRKNREFLIPASLLNKRGRVRILPPEEAYEKCPFRIAEAQERARQIEREDERQEKAA